MRTLCFCLITTITLSCTPAHESESKLAGIENLMEQRPDSALVLLNDILSKTKVQSIGSHMRALLLHAEARSKCHIPTPPPDSLLPVVDYCRHHGTSIESLKANYLLGCSYRDHGEIPAALKCFHRTADMADTTGTRRELSILSHTYDQIARLYHSHKAPHMELEAEQRAVRFAWKAKDTLTVLNFYEHLEEAYDMLNRPADALSISLEASRLYGEYGHKESSAQALGYAISYYVKHANYRQAALLMQKYESESGLFDGQGNICKGREGYYSTKAAYYLGLSQCDSALYFYQKLLAHSDEPSNVEAAYKGLMLLYNKLGRQDSTAKYALLYCDANDAASMKSAASDIARMQSIYSDHEHYRIAQKRASDAKQYKALLFIPSILLLLLVFLGYRIIMRIKQDHKQKLMAANEKYVQALTAYTKAQQEQEELKDNLHQYRAEKNHEIENLRKIVAQYQEDSEPAAEWDLEQVFLNSPITIHVHQLAAKGRTISDKEWVVLYQAVKSAFPGFIEKIESQERHLTNTEIMICIFMKLRFIPSEIKTLLEMSPQRLTNIRSNINSKLFHQKGSKTVDFNIRHLL